MSTTDGLRIGTPTLRATRQSRPGHHPHRSPDQDTTTTGSLTILLPARPEPCGAQGMGSCGCYVRCGRQGCGWLVSTTDDVCRNPLYRGPPRDVACPHCGSEMGRPCHLPDGTPIAWAHARRKAASESVRRFTP